MHLLRMSGRAVDECELRCVRARAMFVFMGGTASVPSDFHFWFPYQGEKWDGTEVVPSQK